MRSCLVCITLVATLGILRPEVGPSQSRDIRLLSNKEAVDLVHMAIDKGSCERFPGFGLVVCSMPYFPNFYFFQGTWRNPNPGSGVCGEWAVDARTGDVWEPFS